MGTSSDSTSLIDDRVSVGQSKKAIAALLQHVRTEQQKKDEMELLPGKEQQVWLVMTVKRMQPLKNLKPHKIPIVHPLVDPRTTSVCLITKDPQREYKDLLESHNIKFISRVVGVQKLKGKFKGFDARRLLLRENGLFLADERVLPLLPGLLGKKWFEAKKQPIPVSLTKKDLKEELEKAISSTYMHQNQGTCTSIKIANISHKDSQVLANLKAAIPAVVAHIHGGWDNVQSLNIKTSSSVSLPIWTCPLGADEPGSRWAGMDVVEGAAEGIEEDEWGGIGGVTSGEETVAVAVDEAPKVKGKKRAAEEQGEEAEGGAKKKRAKKAKASEVPTPTVEAPKKPAKDSTAKKAKTSEAPIPAVEAPKKPAKDSAAKKAKTSEAPIPAVEGPKKPAKDSAAKKAKTSEVPIPASETSKKVAKDSTTKPKKTRTPTDETTSTPASSVTPKARRPSISEAKAATPKGSKAAPITPAPTGSAGELSSKKSKKNRAVTKDSPSAAATPPIPTNKSPASKEQRPEQTLSRDELKKKKKDTLGDAKLEKKKGKLRETEKSTRKGVKAQMVGRVKG